MIPAGTSPDPTRPAFHSMKDLRKTRGLATDIFVFTIFIFLPLYFTDQYFNISADKWAFFTIASVIYIFAVLCLLLFDRGPEASVWFDNFGFIEWSALVFIVFQVISAILSVDGAESFVGAASRHHGLANYLIYILLILIIRKQRISPKHLMPLLAFIGCFEAVFSTLQFLTIDLFGMYAGARKDSVLSFISTIGNVDFFACFLTMTAPLTVYLFISEKRIVMQIIYGLCMVSQFMGGLSCGADSFYLGLFAGLFIMIFAGGLTLREYRRLPFALMLAACGDGFLSWLSSRWRDRQIVISASLKENGAGPISVRALSGLTEKLADLSFLKTFFFAMAAVYALMVVLSVLSLNDSGKSTDSADSDPGKSADNTLAPVKADDTKAPGNTDTALTSVKADDRLVKNPLGITVLAVCAAVLLLAMIIVFIKPPFSDDFGTHRGFVWKLGISDYKSASLLTKLVGYGQETILGVFNGKYYDYMISHQNVVYDNVHCEPLQYLLTTGILGLVSYLVFIGGVLCTLVNRAKKDKGMMLFIIPVFSYFIQSYVNIAQTAGTGIFFLIIALGVNYLRNDRTAGSAKKEPDSASE